MDITSVIGNNTCKFHDDRMTGTLWKGCYRQMDGRTKRQKDRQTEVILELLGCSKKSTLDICDSTICSDVKANASSRDMTLCYIPMGREGSIWHKRSIYDIVDVNHEPEAYMLKWYLCTWVHGVLHILPHNKLEIVDQWSTRIPPLHRRGWHCSKSQGSHFESDIADNS